MASGRGAFAFSKQGRVGVGVELERSVLGSRSGSPSRAVSLFERLRYPARMPRPLLIGLLAACSLFPLAARAGVCGGYAQACCNGRNCSAGFECRGKCHPVHKPEKAMDMGARSTRVVIVNQTPFPLKYGKARAPHGVWSTGVPQLIAPFDYGQWQTDSKGFLTGTEASAIYHVTQPGRRAPLATFSVRWMNPFDGGNKYQVAASAGFAVDRIGGEGNHTTVFFFLRGAAQRPYKCADLWIANHLDHKPLPGLGEFDEAVGFFTTAIKRQGIQGWTYTGCGVEAAGNVVRDTAHSTDGYYTIDIWLTKFRVGSVDGVANLKPGQGRAIRVEVKPGQRAHAAFKRGARQPRKGDKIQTKGALWIDHGHFLELHSSDPIVISGR